MLSLGDICSPFARAGSFLAALGPSAPGSPDADPDPGERPGPSGAARILVVDDEQLVREFAVDLLTSLGYPVAAAADGLEAMRKLEELPSIQMIFTDVVMPGVNGIVLADMAKRRRPELKIIYATGYRDIARTKDEAGILHGPILEKPYRAVTLRSEIERLLS